MTAPVPQLSGVDPTGVVGRRVVAYLVDQLLVFLAVAFAVWALPVEFVSHEPVPGVAYFEPEGSTAAIVAFYLIPVGYWVAAFVVLQGSVGFTPGKFLIGIRTVRFDGRPPGPLKALVRTLFLAIGIAVLGGFWALFALIMAFVTRGHRRLGDLVAGTFVIDKIFEGHLITVSSEGAVAGSRSLYAAEVPGLASEGQVNDADLEARRRPDEPVYDRTRDTYVVWRSKSRQLLAFDKSDKSWSEPA